MEIKEKKFSRRSVLGGALVAVFAAVPLLKSRPALSAVKKAPQSAVRYQTKPNGAQKCGNCVHFQPASDPAASGACDVVEGSIISEGYCLAFAPKPK